MSRKRVKQGTKVEAQSDIAGHVRRAGYRLGVWRYFGVEIISLHLWRAENIIMDGF
ncbi:MAG: hypothetical protein ACYSR9_00420 [Planctomycetota bacterium]